MTPPVQSAVTGAFAVESVPSGCTVIEPPQLPAELPLTLRPPLDPVALKLMPLTAPLAEMLRNSRLLLPIVVLVTVSAVPVVVVRVLTNAPVAPGLQGFSSQTLTVPPPVALNAGFPPVLSDSPPLKVIVPPVFEDRSMPPALSVTAPVIAMLPPV